MGLHASGAGRGTAALDGRCGDVLRQRLDGVVLESRAGRAPGPSSLVDSPGAGDRALRIPRDLPQSSAPTLVARYADTDRVRNARSGNGDEHTSVRSVSRLYRIQGTPEPPGKPGRFSRMLDWVFDTEEKDLVARPSRFGTWARSVTR